MNLCSCMVRFAGRPGGEQGVWSRSRQRRRVCGVLATSPRRAMLGGVRALPMGTVTFLFTDIEGSTRLLQELGDGYAEALIEHKRVLRSTFAAHGGGLRLIRRAMRS